MYKLCGQRTTDGRHKYAMKGSIRIGKCTTPSIGLDEGEPFLTLAELPVYRVVVHGAVWRAIGAGFTSVGEHVAALERARTALDSRVRCTVLAGPVAALRSVRPMDRLACRRSACLEAPERVGRGFDGRKPYLPPCRQWPWFASQLGDVSETSVLGTPKPLDFATGDGRGMNRVSWTHGRLVT